MALLIGVGQPVTTARVQGYDGSSWIDLKVNSDGKVYIQPYVYTAGPETLTSTGAGTTVDTEVGVIYLTWQQINNASSSNPTVKLQGSVDNTNWFDLDESTTIGSEMRHVAMKSVRYVRAYVSGMGDATSISVMIWGIR